MNKLFNRIFRKQVNAYAKHVIQEGYSTGKINSKEMHDLAGIIDRELYPLSSYWKTPGRQVYSDTLLSCIQSTFRCHVWLRICPPNLSSLPK